MYQMFSSRSHNVPFSLGGGNTYCIGACGFSHRCDLHAEMKQITSQITVNQVTKDVRISKMVYFMPLKEKRQSPIQGLFGYKLHLVLASPCLVSQQEQLGTVREELKR